MIQIETLHITPEILKLIAEIDEFKGAWKALGNLAPERLSALRHVASIESIGSSTRIEGSTLSDNEVRELLENLSITSFATRDEQEVAGYAETMEEIFQSWPHISLTENHIRQLHRDLLKYSAKDERHRGNYKTLPNHVATFDESGGEIAILFETASPFATPAMMQELVTWTREHFETGHLHPLLVTGIFIVNFLAIHPFQDGNGRLSRILTTLLLLRAGYAYTPYASLESVIEHNKDGYYRSLRETQKTIWSDSPNWQPWLLFFLKALREQVGRLARKIEREKLLLAALPELSVQILDHAREHGRVSMKEMVLLTGASRNTLKEHFRRLAEKSLLHIHGKGRGVWYSAGDL